MTDSSAATLDVFSSTSAVFLSFVVILCIILGTIMYLIEAPESGFTSIPRSVYWAIVTVTTVGYGDIAPITPLGQFFASCLMIIGYAIIAIPTGIVGAGIVSSNLKAGISTQVCHGCRKEDHKIGAEYCYSCGEKLND